MRRTAMLWEVFVTRFQEAFEQYEKHRLSSEEPLLHRIEAADVQVFGRRNVEPIHALVGPASEKRQGTKSRWVGHWRCRGLYGELSGGSSSKRMTRSG